jgi:hypothetical protein
MAMAMTTFITIATSITVGSVPVTLSSSMEARIRGLYRWMVRGVGRCPDGLEGSRHSLYLSGSLTWRKVRTASHCSDKHFGLLTML